MIQGNEKLPLVTDTVSVLVWNLAWNEKLPLTRWPLLSTLNITEPV